MALLVSCLAEAAAAVAVAVVVAEAVGLPLYARAQTSCLLWHIILMLIQFY